MLDRADQVYTRCKSVTCAEVIDLNFTFEGPVTVLPGHAEARAEGKAVDRVGEASGHSVPLEAAHAHVVPVVRSTDVQATKASRGTGACGPCTLGIDAEGVSDILRT